MDSATTQPARRPLRAGAGPAVPGHVAYFDNLRWSMVVLVVVYHSVAAYSTVAPHFPYHDTPFFAADLIREFLDVFMMPVLFFLAGYFAPASLARNGFGGFVSEKVRRLLVPWALAVFVFVPLLTYGRSGQSVHPFRDYWIWYLGNFATGVSFLPQAQPNQAVYWFLSLLFVFFCVYALIAALARRRGEQESRQAPTDQTASSAQTQMMALLLLGALTSVTYFLGLLAFPDTSWVTVGPFLQFEPTRLILFVVCFALGAYAQRLPAFVENLPGSPLVWTLVAVALAVCYLAVGQPIFATPAESGMGVAALLAFSFSRTYLLLSMALALLSWGARRWNRSGAVARRLSATSYNIYLTHFWFVIVLQEMLLAWTGGAAPLKAATVFVVALALSFAVSRWVIGRYPSAFAAVLILLFAISLAFRG